MAQIWRVTLSLKDWGLRDCAKHIVYYFLFLCVRNSHYTSSGCLGKLYHCLHKYPEWLMSNMFHVASCRKGIRIDDMLKEIRAGLRKCMDPNEASLALSVPPWIGTWSCQNNIAVQESFLEEADTGLYCLRSWSDFTRETRSKKLQIGFGERTYVSETVVASCFESPSSSTINRCELHSRFTISCDEEGNNTICDKGFMQLVDMQVI